MGGLLVCKQEVFFLLKKSQRESGILHWNESEALKSDWSWPGFFIRLFASFSAVNEHYPTIDTRDGWSFRMHASEALSFVLCGRATRLGISRFNTPRWKKKREWQGIWE